MHCKTYSKRWAAVPTKGLVTGHVRHTGDKVLFPGADVYDSCTVTISHQACSGTMDPVNALSESTVKDALGHE